MKQQQQKSTHTHSQKDETGSVLWSSMDHFQFVHVPQVSSTTQSLSHRKMKLIQVCGISRIIILLPYSHHSIRAKNDGREKIARLIWISFLSPSFTLTLVPIENGNSCWCSARFDVRMWWRIRAVNKRDISKLRWFATFIYDSIYNAIIFWGAPAKQSAHGPWDGKWKSSNKSPVYH